MCGIAGYLNLGAERPADAGLVSAMCDTIVHRGPDDQGVMTDGPVGLGMRRLAIIDVASGRQPIANEDGTVHIVFNGEIFNHLGLRDRLVAAGHVFRTHSDTETILHAYEEYGDDCVHKLRGMFAFAIWDAPRRRLLVVRDRLGVKPLFYAQDGERLAFASEMKALLALPGIDRGMDWNAFDAFFTYNYVPAPLTIHRGIRKLEPGHRLICEGGRIRDEQYWDVRFDDKLQGDAVELSEHFLALMGEATAIRLMSEVPLGAFLSGGIDSGVVVALMSKAASAAVNTFTIGFGGETGDFIDERPYARMIAGRYGTEHRELEVVPRIETAIDAAVRAFDEPFADDGLIPTYHICAEAKRHVTVVLTGLGGDEDFGGYERYLGFMLARRYRALPSALRRGVVGPLVRSLREPRSGGNRVNHLKRFVAAGDLPPAHVYQSYIRALDPAGRRRLYAPEVASRIDFDYVESLGRVHFEKLEGGDWLDGALYQDLKMYLPDDILALSDRVGMHHSLELRVPFVDHEVVEFCARLPQGLKIRGTEKKHLLKLAAGHLLPEPVISHRKQGFCAPLSSWLHTDLRPVVAGLLDPARLAAEGYFNPNEVGALVADHHARRNLNDKAIFSLLMFGKWLSAQPAGR